MDYEQIKNSQTKSFLTGNRNALILIYVSMTMINIVNYNRPLPPLQISDLNSRTFFNERDTENPEIRDMFKSLGIIESFGTGIGEAKRSLKENGSPTLFFKEFQEVANVTSVVIPVNEEYLRLKNGGEPGNKLGIERQTQVVKQKIMKSEFSANVKRNMITIYDETAGGVFGNSDVCNVLRCSGTTATTYIKKMMEELQIIKPVTGKGKGKYCFVENLKSRAIIPRMESRHPCIRRTRAAASSSPRDDEPCRVADSTL